MTLGETLQRKLADWRPPDRQTLELSHEDGWTVSLTAECVDRVGALLWDVCLRRAAPAPAAGLEERAKQLSQRITGLLEPLTLVEVDLDRSQAQLRSSAPRQQDDQLAYYELLLQGDGGAELRRFVAGRQGGRRQQIAFTLTHDALAQLVTDLTAPA